MSLLRRILAEKRGLIYPLIGALVLNAALYAAVVYPLSLKVANGERDANAARTARARAQSEYELARATILGKDSADAELKKFYEAVLPPDFSAARRLLFGSIEKAAAEAGVKQESETYEINEPRQNALHRMTATVDVVGEYRSIRRFIHGLETAPEFIVVENVALTQGSRDQQTLNVALKIATYFRTGGNGN
jgi:Tfp pilus assembly protein PilO